MSAQKHIRFDVTVNPGNYVRYGISPLPILGGSGQLFRGKNDYLYVVDNKGRSLQAFDNSAQGYSLSLVTKPSEDINLGTNTNTFAGAYLPLQNHKVINEPDPAQVDFTRELSHKTYELVDHLGNVTVTLTDERSVPTLGGAQSWAKVLSYTNYYAFGMAMPGRTCKAGSYRYGFNGKENDSETGTQDYGFRIYNPALGRFLSVDPLTKDYPELTPYQFASNTPIMYIDIDGLEGGVPTAIPYTDPMQPVWKAFSDEFEGVANFFDSFSFGQETTVTTEESSKTDGPVTGSKGTETKYKTEASTNFSGVFCVLKYSQQSLSSDQLPSLIKTEQTTTSSDYEQLDYTKGKVKFTEKTTTSVIETKVEMTATVGVTIKKVPVKLKGSGSISTTGQKDVKIQISTDLSKNLVGKLGVKISTNSNTGKSKAQVSVGGETQVGKSKVSKDFFIQRQF